MLVYIREDCAEEVLKVPDPKEARCGKVPILGFFDGSQICQGANTPKKADFEHGELRRVKEEQWD